MNIEDFLKESILQTLFEARNDCFSHQITNANKTKKYRNNMEKRLKSVLNYVDGEHYKSIEKEIDEILWDLQGYVEYWDSTFYKFGLVDGMNLEKEIKKELEKKLNG